MKFLILALSLFSSKAIALDPAAAEKVANTDPKCVAIQPFYWEIGDAGKVLTAGSTGDKSIKRDTRFPIASASKWMFGAYVVQRLQDKIDPATQSALNMTSGYTSFKIFSCIFARTAGDCFQKKENSVHTAANDGKFFYNGGHFQKWAQDHGLGPMNADEITKEYKKYLGNDVDIQFSSLQFAGGITTSAAGYAKFLQKILHGDLLIKNELGKHAVCTAPGKCPTAVYSPAAPSNWHYGDGYWIEDDPAGGDGSFSSAGLFGFYPWIDASQTYYGVVSRQQKNFRDEGRAGQQSAQCGYLIRKAFLGQK